jgi:GMP synthase-like glutamine amidotransferase
MRILGLVHEPDVPAGTFADVVRDAGAELRAWGVAELGPPRDLDGYDGVISFGGGMHPDQDHLHPWILGEVDLLRRLVDEGVPTLGICLGAELLARSLGARVGPVEPEVGFVPVRRTGEADALLDRLPPRFDALQWHSYGFELPEGAAALAHSASTLQAFRAGGRAWGVQFHPEVDRAIVARWAVDERQPVPDGDYVAWAELGSRICRGFLSVCGMRL